MTGLSNNCVVNLKMQPAITYNDQAVLENDALCKALSLAGDNGFNLWEKLPRQLQQVLRTTVIQLVLR